MPVETEKFIARLYREAQVPRRRGLHPLRRLRMWWERPRRPRPPRPPRRPLGPRLRRWARRHAVSLTVISVLIVAWLFVHIYWYNKLVNLECNVQAAWAQVEVEQERRYHVQLNLIRVVVGYARHEREVVTETTELRTRAAGAAPRTRAAGASPGGGLAEDLASLSRDQVNDLFPRIMLMAEQYPTLRATENFQQLAGAVIDSETRVTTCIHAYNDEVNIYSTVIGQFPGNIFAAIWHFDTYEFYAPPPGTTDYRPLQYDPAAPTSGPAPPPPPPPPLPLPAAGGGAPE